MITLFILEFIQKLYYIEQRQKNKSLFKKFVVLISFDQGKMIE